MRFVLSKVRNLLHRGCYTAFDWLNKPWIKYIFFWLILQNIYRELFYNTQWMDLCFEENKKKLVETILFVRGLILINFHSYQSSSTLCFPPFFHQLSLLAIFVHELSLLPSSMHSVTQSLKCCPCLFIQVYLNFILILSKFYPYIPSTVLACNFCAWTFPAAFINALCDSKSKVLSMSFYPGFIWGFKKSG